MKVHCKESAKRLGVKAEKDLGEIAIHAMSGDRALVVFPSYTTDGGVLVPAYANVLRLDELREYVERVGDERSKRSATWQP